MISITKGYRPMVGAYSEMLNAQGEPRPHWHTMLNQLENYGPADIDARWQRAQRMIRENGVTYNVYGDTRGISRPWVLDPVPRMIEYDEWAVLSAGLIQRMEVLNRTLGDLYGEQQLLKQSVLPSALLFGNPNFLRPCCRIRPPDGQYLTVHAVDVARSPSGEWRVVKDLTQSPPGAGYALENRLIVSRTFPTMYRNSGVERLAPFFMALRENLNHLARNISPNPRIVVLTPGPYSSSYFEHAYIARYLGFTLVQAAELTVRANQVFLKTLSGLHKVDVILRRQNDVFCDPLELASHSALGIPGLVQAAAAGEVVVANALGSGLAETPALLPFIPGLCRNLLGEEPKLASLNTLWCGQERECRLVLDTFDRWVIKRAFKHQPRTSIFVHALSPTERRALAEKIKAQPDQYIAQENMRLSTAPCWQDGKLIARHNMLRAYIVATADGWEVMPGGLVRTSRQADSTIVSMEDGGGSKDAWVHARGQINPLTLLPRDRHKGTPDRTDDTLSSRVADNLFWLGRYVQRAEMQARLLRTILRRMTEETLPDGSPELPELLVTLAKLMDQPPQATLIEDPIQHAETTRKYLYHLIFNHQTPSNLRHTVTSATNIGSLVRERISVDTWRILDRMNTVLHEAPQDGDLTDALDMLDQLLMPLAAFSGLSSESMTHDYGWRFMDMGFRIERATMSARVLRELLDRPQGDEVPVLDAILEVANSSITYRSRYFSQVAALPLLDLLLTDESNPRSIAYQLVLIEQHVRELAKLPTCNILPEQQLAAELIQRVHQFDLSPAVNTLKKGQREDLSDFLDLLIDRTYELSNRISQLYLAHVQPTSRLSATIGLESGTSEDQA